MPASAARIAANRANSLKSCGPKTPEGKLASRANSVKHGLCSTVVVRPDEAGMVPTHPRGDGLGGWFERQVALLTLRVERCQAMQVASRHKQIARASITWDEDRKGEAVTLGAKLAGRPEEVVARLRETVHGCEWLLNRWAMLAHAASTQPGGWTVEQTGLAFDLLSTPDAFRRGVEPGTVLDVSGAVLDLAPPPAEVARRAIQELRERIEALEPLDQTAREQAEAGLADENDELKRLRRYEAELHRRIKWSLEQIQAPQEPDDPEPAPEPESEAEPVEPRPAPSPTDRPLTRAERRLVRAESRREAKRRKLDQLRN